MNWFAFCAFVSALALPMAAWFLTAGFRDFVNTGTIVFGVFLLFALAMGRILR